MHQLLHCFSYFHLVITADVLPMSVPKARIRKLLFWLFSDVRDQFAHISVGSAQIALQPMSVPRAWIENFLFWDVSKEFPISLSVLH
jgi:hypothetical protein